MKNLSYLLVLIFIFTITACKPDSKQKIVNLKVEYSTEPNNLDVENPRFSWQLYCNQRDIKQTEYKILVATKPSLLKNKKADVWNSGWQSSDQSVFVEFGGEKLESGKDYFWNVSIKTNNVEISGSSKISKFSTAFLNENEWIAKWIAYTPEKDPANKSSLLRSTLLRKEFTLKAEPISARIYISGLGNYKLSINGEKIGNDLLTPGWTDYRKRVQYQVYDVTENLLEGDNAIGIMLGNMWWSGGLGWSGAQVYSEGPLMAIAQLDIQYKNGEKELIITDNDWRANLSPIVENSLYHGEIYDSRLEIQSWSEAGLEDSKWSSVELISIDTIKLSAQKAPEIRIADEISPVSITEVNPGVYVFDMGINMVGFTRIKVKGSNGDTIVQRFAELLHPDGTVAQENLRSALATDYYIMKGEEEEVWEPSFTYHGFRYVQVEGLKYKPEMDMLTGLRFYSSAPVVGNFECSNDLLNNIWGNILNGQKGNMHSVPTDCPQRDERLGWMGDAQIFAPTASYNMNMAKFFAKWVRDITDSQHESGYVYDVNPQIVVDGPSKAGWGDAVTVVPMQMYKFYGDKRILADSYNGMKAWVEYMRNKSENHIYRWSKKAGDWEGYGDWISVVPSPTEPISAAYYYYSTKILANTAEILDNKNDNKLYNLLADSIKHAFHDKFFDEKNINYPEGTQTANLLPYSFGLTPEEYKSQIVKNIADDVNAKGKHPSTGFLGTAYLLPVLSDNNYHQLAFETAISEDYPSWGYMVKNGATSMWELWNSDTEPPDRMNSRNHFALGSVSEWYFSHLGGIKPLKPGFKEILIAPKPAEGLDWVKVNYETPYGKLISEWEKSEDLFEINITIPANSSASLVLPLKSESFTLCESEVNIEPGIPSEIEGIKLFEISEGTINIDLNSGSYQFIIDYSK